MDSILNVGIADYKIGRGSQQLITRDLGSCVGVAVRDPESGVGGLLHIMLPKCPKDVKEELLPKYADSGIELMIKKMLLAGAKRDKLVAKIAGAAHIVKTQDVPESQDISSRNLIAVKNKLKLMGIPILAMDVEDYIPRTVIFEPESGVLQIKTCGKPDKII